MARVKIGNIKGPKGDPGKNGIDGRNPTITLEETNSGVMIEAHNPDGSSTIGYVSHGNDGKAGPQGPQGVQGEKGERGEKGLKGDKGEQGVQGIQGLQGPPGKTGAQGPAGKDGASFDAEVSTVTFEEAVDDEPIESGDTISTHFGRIRKLFTRFANTDYEVEKQGKKIITLEGEVEITNSTQEAFKAIGWTPPSGGGEIASLFQFLLDRIHPIGSYYISDNPTNPKELFGGSWVEVSGVYLFARSSAHPAGEVFGSSTKKLVAGNIPAHTHPFSATASSAGSHYHQMADRKIYAGTGNYYACVAYSYSKPTAYSNTSSSGAHTHSVSGTTGASGSGTAFDILPPSKSVYVWRRTA